MLQVLPFVEQSYNENETRRRGRQLSTVIIPVGKLQVATYIPIRCKKHCWCLSVQPVIECPYFLCVKNGDRSAYDTYMDLWAKRTPAVKHEHPYDDFLKLVERIRLDGDYKPEKAQPMTLHKGTSLQYTGHLLQDGHHRAAIICALFGPGKEVPVEEDGSEPPKDLYLCDNPCTA